MSQEISRSVVASIRQRLLNRARERGEDFNFVLTMYGIERFAYRLSKSDHADRFYLKGAILFLAWTGEYYRPTRDIDLLSLGLSDVPGVVAAVRAVCRVPCPEDGVAFLDDSIRGEEIREVGAYPGVRIHLMAKLGVARIPLQIDIGLGNAVVPGPTKERLPSMLDLPTPVLKAYPPEAMIAEKYEAMVDLGLMNSRMNDFYDIWILCTEYQFRGVTLCEAIRATFGRRGTALPRPDPVALTSEFYNDVEKQKQWRAFLLKGGFKRVEQQLESVIGRVRVFLIPPTQALVHGKDFKMIWEPPGPWQLV